MANKPVLGIIDCPHCGRANMVGWNGNYKTPCFFCKKKFMVKRTRLHHTTPITVNENAKQHEESCKQKSIAEMKKVPQNLRFLTSSSTSN